MGARKSRLLLSIVLFPLFLLAFCFISNPFVFAQTWQALPPYNFLWPLWSPALSPLDPITGIKVPIISNLYPTTALPLQPGIVWNPAFTDPYFLYNSPLGLQYYDLLYGINPWPPSYSIDATTGLPIPITPPVGYQFLPPTDSQWIQDNLPIANLAYLAQYPSWAQAAYVPNLPPNLTGLIPWLASLVYPTPSFTSLLTTGQILGYTPVTAITAPTAVVPAPTTVVSAPTATVPAPALIPVNPVAGVPAPVPVPITVSITFPPAPVFPAFIALQLLGLL